MSCMGIENKNSNFRQSPGQDDVERGELRFWFHIFAGMKLKISPYEYFERWSYADV